MKGATMLATMQKLGVMPSFSRPSVSNDNPFSESLFKTLKYCPQFSSEPFLNIVTAREWAPPSFLGTMTSSCILEYSSPRLALGSRELIMTSWPNETMSIGKLEKISLCAGRRRRGIGKNYGGQIKLVERSRTIR